MKRISLFFSLWLVAFALSLGASKPPVMYVEYFSVANENYLQFIEEVRSAVFAGIEQTERFTLVDVASQQSLQIEESRRSSLQNLPDSLSRNGLMKQLGANYILSGTLHTLTCDNYTFGDDVIGYMSTVALTLKIIDTSDGSTLTLEDIKFLGNKGGFAKTTPADALANLMVHIRKAMPPFVNETFPVEGKVVDSDFEEKRGEMLNCYVTMGQKHGMRKGTRLVAYEVKYIAGERITKAHGKLKVVEVVSDGLSRCEVLDEGKYLLEAIKKYHKQVALDPEGAMPVLVRPDVNPYQPDNSKALNKARVGAGSRAVWGILQEAMKEAGTETK